jgi:predicted DNA-binding protein
MNRYVNATKLSITLDKQLAHELDEVAKELGEKKSRLIGNALMYYFDMLDEKLADKRLKELEEGSVKTIPAEEVWKELGV